MFGNSLQNTGSNTIMQEQLIESMHLLSCPIHAKTLTFIFQKLNIVSMKPKCCPACPVIQRWQSSHKSTSLRLLVGISSKQFARSIMLFRSSSDKSPYVVLVIFCQHLLQSYLLHPCASFDARLANRLRSTSMSGENYDFVKPDP